MLDLNAKLSTFRKMVWDEEKQRSEKELYNSTNINSQMIDEKRKKLDKEMEKSIESRRSFSNIRYNEQYAKLQEEEKANFYAHKNKLLDDLIKEVNYKLEAYTKTEAYKNNLPKEIAETINQLNLSDGDFEILVKEADLDLIDYSNKAAMEDYYIGGFIIRALDGSFQYNATYLNKIKEKEYEIGRVLFNLFEKELVNESNN